MTLYCENSLQISIIYRDENDIDKKFTTKNVPVDIICEETQRTGKYIYQLAVSGYTGNCQPIGDRAYKSTHIADSYTVGTGTPVSGYEQCAFYGIDFKIDSSVVSNSNVGSDWVIVQSPNPNYSKGGKQIVIKSQFGEEIFRQKVKDCDFKISCGDDCPDGQMKCKCDSYPGYCCVSCNEIISGINSATATLRGIKS